MKKSNLLAAKAIGNSTSLEEIAAKLQEVQLLESAAFTAALKQKREAKTVTWTIAGLSHLNFVVG